MYLPRITESVHTRAEHEGGGRSWTLGYVGFLNAYAKAVSCNKISLRKNFHFPHLRFALQKENASSLYPNKKEERRSSLFFVFIRFLFRRLAAVLAVTVFIGVLTRGDKDEITVGTTPFRCAIVVIRLDSVGDVLAVRRSFIEIDHVAVFGVFLFKYDLACFTRPFYDFLHSDKIAEIARFDGDFVGMLVNEREK